MYAPVSPQIVTVHRCTIRKDLINVFSDANIMNCTLDVVMIDARGEPESGKGKGVVLDMLTNFWHECFISFTVGKHHSSVMTCKSVNGRLLQESLFTASKNIVTSPFSFLLSFFYHVYLGKKASLLNFCSHLSRIIFQLKTKKFWMNALEIHLKKIIKT